uniref:Aspartic proteinase nepenthesin-2 n=1 Tax=Aegilops tauschii TaxID=37682 RepID=M8B0Y0_AEGTA
MASIPKFLLLLLCTYLHTLVAHGGDNLRSYKVLHAGSLKSATVNCSQPKAVSSSSGGVTVPLHHRHGPCSPVPSTEAPTLEEMLRRDQFRAAYITRKYSGVMGGAGDVEQSDVTVPTTLGTSLGTLEYLITVGIGSPAMTQTMLIDTGSDVSWVQCKPCSQCHTQADSLFDPSSSSTYSAFPCSSSACTQLRQSQQGNGCSSGSQCQYIVKYGDGSSGTGTYSSDKLTLGSSSVSYFQFGCSQSESGNLLEDQTDGLMGLGGGAQSLATQTAGTLGKAFSYCLPPTPDSSGFLTLGAATSGFAKTQMLRSSAPAYYGVLLEAIRPMGIFDTCFNFSGQSPINIPSVALVFSGGVVVDLATDGIILDSCLAFAANSDDSSLGIIGNVQQRTIEVLYDVGGGAVGFKAGAC